MCRHRPTGGLVCRFEAGRVRYRKAGSAMQNPLFREKSLERVASPEQLQDYMRVTSPGIWMVLAAVVALLVGGIVCAATGRLETTLAAKAVVEKEVATVSLSEAQAKSVKAGMSLRLGGQETPIEYVYQSEDGRTIASAAVALPNGRYDAQIVTESIAPISFLLND